MVDDIGPETLAYQRREQMLAAAGELISERGFAATRIVDVARRAGASPALVIYYFGTKDRLLIEALRHSERLFDEMARELLAQTTSFAERLQTIIDLSCRATGNKAGAWGLWLELWVQALHRPEVARSRVALDDEWRALIERIVRDGVASGEVGDVDVANFVVTFAALLDGLLIQVVLEDPYLTSERAGDIALRFARTALGMDAQPVG